MSKDPKVDNSIAGETAVQASAETIQAAEAAAQPAAEPAAQPAFEVPDSADGGQVFRHNGRDFFVAAEPVRACALLHGTEIKMAIKNAIAVGEKLFMVAEQPLIALIQRHGILLPKAADANSGEDTL